MASPPSESYVPLKETARSTAAAAAWEWSGALPSVASPSPSLHVFRQRNSFTEHCIRDSVTILEYLL